MRLSAGLEDETVLEIKVLWQTAKEGVVLSVDFPGPNYKVQVCANSCALISQKNCFHQYTDNSTFLTGDLDSTVSIWGCIGTS